MTNPTTSTDPAADTVAEKLFASTESLNSTYLPSIKDSLDRLTDATGLTSEQREAHLADASHFFHDARINTSEASTLHSLLVHHTEKPASAETVQEWTTESRRLLRERYGPDAERRMAQAKAFIAARPGMAQQLAKSGMGSHPRLVLSLAERAHELRVTPRASVQRGRK